MTNRGTMSQPLHHILRTIPKVDRVLEWQEIKEFLLTHTRIEVLTAVRSALDQIRRDAVSGKAGAPIDPSAVAEIIRSDLARLTAASLRPVINGTGIIVHTNLGRSPLSESCIEAVAAVSRGYSTLEYDLDSGTRGTRYAHVEGLVCELTGAEAALVVNNNAAAVILALSALAAGREVIVSRGELVEIGGSFRIPDVMRQSGATLVEVGTTNRTHPHDYQSAMTEQTGLLLKVHTSNFAVVGFTAETGVDQLAEIGHARNVPVMLDAGSGCLIDLTPYGISGEPTIASYLDLGADLVTFSGDKLLGGPQAGIIAGKQTLVEQMKRHPLLRALRIDKLSLAALETTLRLYRDPQRALGTIPTLRMLTMTPHDVSRRAGTLVRKMRRALSEQIILTERRGESGAGGGAFPLLRLPTTLLEIKIPGASPERIDHALRQTRTPVIGRIQHDRFLLDVRTILDQDMPGLITSLNDAAAHLAQEPA